MNKTDSKPEILTFNTVEEFYEEATKVLKMNHDELKAYEETKGYKSFGRKCDEVYMSINPENFSSYEEIVAFTNSNSQYLELIMGTDGEVSLETVVSRNPERYLINNDKMFKIGNMVYKVLKKGIVSINEESAGLLKKSDDFDILTQIQDPNIHFSINPNYSNPSELKDADYNCGTHKEDRATDGRDRTLIKINYSTVPSGVFLNFRASVMVRPYMRTMGVWFYCARTISWNFKVAVDEDHGNGWERHYAYDSNPGKHDSVIEWLLTEGIYMGHSFHFAGFDCWGDTPSTAPAKIQCNTSLF